MTTTLLGALKARDPRFRSLSPGSAGCVLSLCLVRLCFAMIFPNPRKVGLRWQVGLPPPCVLAQLIF